MLGRILVVDDEPDLEILVSQKFRRRIRNGELSFLFAGNGEEALSMLREEPDVDIVLSDINMPRMDGLALLKRLKDLDDQPHAVIVSAYGDMPNIRTAMNLGAFDFVTKPIEFEDLELTINKTLDDLKKTREAHQARIAAEQARANLARYFSPSVAERLAEDPESLDLRGDRRELTFVFTDLTAFTPLVETLEPQVIVPLLNEYLGEMTQIIFQHGGTVDKIVGDAVHAMFGAPLEKTDHAACGVACAMELDRFAEAFRERQTAKGVALGVTRIGVHSGPVIVGNFGGELFFDYTAHGDAINTVARLENVNKQLGTRICVSDKVVEQIPDFKGRPVGRVVLKGKSQGLNVYEPLTTERADAPAMIAYREAFAKLEAGDPDASQAFAAVMGQYGGDPLATFHLKRLLAGETGDLITLQDE
jgi:adenylate cyclase